MAEFPKDLAEMLTNISVQMTAQEAVLYALLRTPTGLSTHDHLRALAAQIEAADKRGTADVANHIRKILDQAVSTDP